MVCIECHPRIDSTIPARGCTPTLLLGIGRAVRNHRVGLNDWSMPRNRCKARLPWIGWIAWVPTLDTVDRVETRTAGRRVPQ
eukprot:scaffold18379_cov98-Cyclotella_meneghiniana.AAC.1